jgi:hypothetical protein
MKDYFTSISLPDAPGAETLPSPEPAPLPDGTGNSTNIAVGGVEVVAVEKIADLVQTTMKCATAYKMCQLQEETKRKAISADLQKALAQIHAAKELYHDMLVSNFTLYENGLNEFTEVAKKAAQVGDHVTLRETYNLILSIYGQLPNMDSEKLTLLRPN